MRQVFNQQFRSMQWKPVVLRPDAWSTSRYDDVARLARGERGRMLELGCSAGQLMVALAPHFDALTGVDIADERIELAQRLVQERYPEYASRMTFLVAPDDGSLPCPDNAFDVVIACTTLEYVPYIFRTMAEIRRVCRPGGCCIISVGNISYVRHGLGLLRGTYSLPGAGKPDMSVWRECGWAWGAVRYFNKPVLSELLRHHGFTPEVWTGAGPCAPLRRWYLNLCGVITVRARKAAADPAR